MRKSIIDPGKKAAGREITENSEDEGRRHEHCTGSCHGCYHCLRRGGGVVLLRYPKEAFPLRLRTFPGGPGAYRGEAQGRGEDGPPVGGRREEKASLNIPRNCEGLGCARPRSSALVRKDYALLTASLTKMAGWC